MSIRFLGLDYGEKTIGVSLGCSESKVATGLTTLRRTEEAALRANINSLREIVRRYNITHIVLGYPLNMDGSISMRAEKTLSFRDKLQRNFKSINILMWDERLSTRAVTIGFGSTNSKKKREAYRAYIDEMAAVYILQGYLNKYAVSDLSTHRSDKCPYAGRLEKNMENEIQLPDDQNELEDIIIITDDDGNEYQLHVLTSKEHDGSMYLLTAVVGDDDDDDETAEVMHFKCVIDEDDETDDMSMETVDAEHEDFDLVLKLFEDDYEEFGITIDEGDSLLGI